MCYSHAWSDDVGDQTLMKPFAHVGRKHIKVISLLMGHLHSARQLWLNFSTGKGSISSVSSSQRVQNDNDWRPEESPQVWGGVHNLLLRGYDGWGLHHVPCCLILFRCCIFWVQWGSRRQIAYSLNIESVFCVSDRGYFYISSPLITIPRRDILHVDVNGASSH